MACGTCRRKMLLGIFPDSLVKRRCLPPVLFKHELIISNQSQNVKNVFNHCGTPGHEPHSCWLDIRQKGTFTTKTLPQCLQWSQQYYCSLDYQAALVILVPPEHVRISVPSCYSSCDIVRDNLSICSSLRVLDIPASHFFFSPRCVGEEIPRSQICIYSPLSISVSLVMHMLLLTIMYSVIKVLFEHWLRALWPLWYITGESVLFRHDSIEYSGDMNMRNTSSVRQTSCWRRVYSCYFPPSAAY